MTVSHAQAEGAAGEHLALQKTELTYTNSYSQKWRDFVSTRHTSGTVEGVMHGIVAAAISPSLAGHRGSISPGVCEARHSRVSQGTARATIYFFASLI